MCIYLEEENIRVTSYGGFFSFQVKHCVQNQGLLDERDIKIVETLLPQRYNFIKR